MHKVLVNRLGGLSLPMKNVVRLTDRPDMTLDVYRGHKQQKQIRGSRVVRWCLVNFQCQCVLLIWVRVEPTVLIVGAGGGCLDIFSFVYHFSFLSPSL